MDGIDRRIALWITYGVSLIATVVTFGVLLARTNIALTGKLGLDQLETLITVAILLAFALSIGFGLRNLLAPLAAPERTPPQGAALADPQQPTRDRLAR